MTIFFSICSNNYLAQASTLFESLAFHHPEATLLLFLVDEPRNEMVVAAAPHRTIVVSEEQVPEYRNMINRFTVIELNSSIRPFLFQYLHRQYPNADRLMYIDPDMVVYNRLEDALQLLEAYPMVVTPHFIDPLPLDDKTPDETLALRYGTYNLGFFAINPLVEETRRFLEWWGARTSRFGYADPDRGYFVDQIWFNIATVYFKGIAVLRHKGYNMACWNLHERRLRSFEKGTPLMLTDGSPLVFYHFSQWHFSKPDQLCTKFNRYNFSNRPDLLPLYQDYHERLLRNGIETYSQLACALPCRKPYQPGTLRKLLEPGVRLVKKTWNRI